MNTTTATVVKTAGNPGIVIMQVSLSLSKNDNGRSPYANVFSILSTDAERMNSVSAPA